MAFDPSKFGAVPVTSAPKDTFDPSKFGAVAVSAPIPPSNIPGADLPKSEFGQRVSDIAKGAGEEGVAAIKKTAEEFAKAPAVEKPLYALKAPTQATGAAARILFSPLSAAIEGAIEHISDLPAVQRVAMSENIGKLLDATGDIGIKVGDIATKHPEQAQAVQDFIDTISLAVGPKVAKPIAGAVEKAGARVATKVSEALPKRAVSAAESDADALLSAPIRGKGTGVADIFKKYNIEPPVSAITESRAIQGAEAAAQSAWFGGTEVTKIVEEAQSGISKVAESLRKYADPQALVKPGVTLENVGKDLKDALGRTKKAFDEAKTKLYDDATSKIGPQQAILAETRKALDDIIESKLASADPTARASARYYQSLRANLSTAEKRTFDNIKRTRSDIGSKLKNRMDPITTGDSANLKRIYGALSRDLDVTVSQSGQEAANALKAADALYKAGITKINSMVGRTIQNARSPERIFGSLVKAGDATAVRELKELVGEEAFRTVGDAFVNSVISAIVVPLTGKINPGKLATMLAKYGDDMIRELVGEKGLQQLKDLLRGSIADDIIERSTLDGKVQPGRLAQVIESYDDKILRDVFSPDEYQKLMDLKQMAKAMGKGTKLVAGSPTAEKLQLGINVALGVGPGVGILLSKLGIEYGVTKLFTTPWGKRLLTKGVLGKGGKIAPTASKMAEEVPVVASEAKVPETGQISRTAGGQEGVYRYSEKGGAAVPRETGGAPVISVVKKTVDGEQKFVLEKRNASGKVITRQTFSTKSEAEMEAQSMREYDARTVPTRGR